MIDGNSGKGAASRTHNGGEARGKGYRGGARLRTVGGYRGEKEGRSRSEDRKTRRGEKVRRVGVVWVQLLARVYILLAIYYIFIYILSIYL